MALRTLTTPVQSKPPTVEPSVGQTLEPSDGRRQRQDNLSHPENRLLMNDDHRSLRQHKGTGPGSPDRRLTCQPPWGADPRPAAPAVVTDLGSVNDLGQLVPSDCGGIQSDDGESPGIIRIDL